MTQRTKNMTADERRMATVETLIDLAGEQNPSNITTTAIADRMGVSQGALFRHFTNKDAILEAALNWVSKHLLTRINKAAHSSNSPIVALEAIFMAHINFIYKHPGVPRMLFSELQGPEKNMTKQMVQGLSQQYEKKLRELLKTGKDIGELDTNLDIDAAALLFIGTIQGLVVRSLITNNSKQIKLDAPRLFEIYRRGISYMDNLK